MVIIVESLTYKYIDYLNEGKKYGVTPNIDKIASEGLIFSNFFANGQRSIEGAQAILTGIPPLPGIPDIISLSVNYSRLGELAKANHYRTIFVTSTLKESFSLDLMVFASGIEEYYGRNDYNLLLNYPKARERTLGWDYETLMLISDKGMLVRTRVAEVNIIGRNTQGVTVIRLKDSEKLISIAPISEEFIGDE